MDSRVIIWSCVGAISVAAAFVSGLYLGNPGDVSRLPLSPSQVKAAEELAAEFEGLPVLRGSFFTDEKKGVAGYADPSRADYERWLRGAVWVAYDAGFDQGKREGAKLLPQHATELLTHYKEALQLSSMEGRPEVSKAQAREQLARASATLLNAEWKAKHGMDLGLDETHLEQFFEFSANIQDSRKAQRSIGSLQFELDLRKALAEADKARGSSRSEVGVVYRQP